jgi:hypothetical protein
MFNDFNGKTHYKILLALAHPPADWAEDIRELQLELA